MFVRIKVSRVLEMFCLPTARLLQRRNLYVAMKLLLMYAESVLNVNADVDRHVASTWKRQRHWLMYWAVKTRGCTRSAIERIVGAYQQACNLSWSIISHGHVHWTDTIRYELRSSYTPTETLLAMSRYCCAGQDAAIDASHNILASANSSHSW
jgi:hypothetical protein